MILCLRTVAVPPEHRGRFLAWIQENRELRTAHGILLELVLEPSSSEGDTHVITAWPSHEVFDSWINTPHRDRLTASEVHQSVEFRPITRYDVAAGYMNLQLLKMEVPE